MGSSTIPGNPWLSIWTEPRKTVRTIVNKDPKFGYLILCAAYGFPIALNLVQGLALSATIPFWALVIGALVVCTFLGIIGISVSSWLVHIFGKLLGGKATFQIVRTAVAWSNVPNFVIILMRIIVFIVFGPQMFNKNFPEMQFIGYQAGTLFLAALIEVIAAVWGFIILISGLREVQEFSIWKSILNVVVPFAIVDALLFWGAAWAFGGSTIS